MWASIEQGACPSGSLLGETLNGCTHCSPCLVHHSLPTTWITLSCPPLVPRTTATHLALTTTVVHATTHLVLLPTLIFLVLLLLLPLICCCCHSSAAARCGRQSRWPVTEVLKQSPLSLPQDSKLPSNCSCLNYPTVTATSLLHAPNYPTNYPTNYPANCSAAALTSWLPE